GSAGVYVFFVLSGFVLSSSFSKRFDSILFFAFLLKRYIRLMVPVFFSCLIGWAVYSHIDINRTGISEWASNLGTFDYSLHGAIFTGLIGAFGGDGVKTYNWVLWTMKIELIGSYILALLFISKKTNSALFPAIVFLIFLSLGYYNDGDALYYGLACFMSGSVIYKTNIKLSKKSSVAILILGLYFAGYKVQSYAYSSIFSDINNYLTEYTLFLFSGIFIVLFALKSNGVNNILSTKPAIFLGKISFSLYLLQMVLIYAVAIPSFNYLSLRIDELAASLISIIICVAISLPVSWGFYRLFDKPAVLLSGRISKVLLQFKTA
ncbi:acyltransferase, partial [Escherichia coli]